jgi:anti-sigma B factor antagonist
MNERQRLALTCDLTIYHALEQKALLLEALAAIEAGDELELDLVNVGDIDTAGLQLLLLLKKEAQRAGKRVAIVAHSQAVRALIDFCKLAAEMGDPLVIPAAEAA